jgi:2-dehydropantoate 2-reductase
MAGIVVVGAGGVGGCFGRLLARHGEDVTFIARGRTLEALQTEGLTVHSKLAGDFTVRPGVTSDPASLESPDLVLFCVKTYDLESAAEKIRPLIGPETVVLPLQNGIDASERLGRILGDEAVLAGVTYVRAFRSAPSVVEHLHSTQIILGEPRGGLSERVQVLAERLQAAGIAAEAQENSLTPMWTKFAGTCAAMVCAMTRQAVGPVLTTPEMRSMFQDTLQEVFAVGRARGVPFPDDIVDRLMTVVDGYPPSAKPSLLEDLEAGRPLELENLTGTVLRLGRELGVPTPLSRAIYVSLLPFVDGAPRPPDAAAQHQGATPA